MNGGASRIGLSSVLVLIGILLIGVTEQVLLAAGQIWTNLFFMMGFICEKELWLARAARRKGRPRPLPDDSGNCGPKEVPFAIEATLQIS